MGRLLTAFALALRQLGDRAVLRVLAKSLAVTLAIFTAAGAGCWYGLSLLFARLGVGAGNELGALAAIAIVVPAAWLMFRLVALAVLQFFADEVVVAVERRHYPADAANARDLPLASQARVALGGIGRALVANIIALPFALALLFTGIGTVLLFWAVNAVLLGRELQDMVWLRHRHAAPDLAPMAPLERFALGGAVAALLAVPLLNLLAPVIGAAAATHMIHTRARETA